MKLNFEQSIGADLQTVWSAFNNPHSKGSWLRNFESLTHKSGSRGQPGAVSELIFNEGKKKVVIKETITERRDPTFLACIYRSTHGTTIIVNHFEAVDGSTTRWTSWRNSTFNGMMKFTSFFTASAIRKRTEEDMQRFKLLVETNEVNNAT